MPAPSLAWPVFQAPAPVLAWSIGRAREADRKTFKTVQRAVSAGRETLSDRQRQDRATVARIKRQLKKLRQSLAEVVFSEAGSVTDFRRFQATALIRDVDRIIAESTTGLIRETHPELEAAFDQGVEHATRPLMAAKLVLVPDITGLDFSLIQAGFDNTVDLLTPTMQRLRQRVVTSIRAVALAGESRQGAIDRLRDQIASPEDKLLGGDALTKAAFQAERIIRTEVSRIFNAATYDRLLALSRNFPFLRKGWRDSKDSRVRGGHTAAGKRYSRGKGIPISEKFKVPVFDSKGKKRIGTVRMRFPVDPLAEPAGRLAAAATILCRCNSFIDFDLEDFQAFTRAQLGGVSEFGDLTA